MEFTEQKAKEVVDKFSLSEKTIAVWRMRGAIPNKYAKPDIPIKKVEGLKDNRKAERLVEVLNNDKLNVRKLGELCGIDENRIQDIRRGKTFITESELTELSKAINRLKIDTAKALSALSNRMRIGSSSLFDVFKLVHREEIKLFIVMKQDRANCNAVKYASDNKTDLSAPVCSYLRDCLDILLLELNL